MVTGVHTIVHTEQAPAVRDFLADVLGWDSVDAGHGGSSSPCRRASSLCIRARGPVAMSCT